MLPRQPDPHDDRAGEAVVALGGPSRSRAGDVLRARRHRPGRAGPPPVADLGEPHPWPWLLSDRPAEHLAKLVILSTSVGLREKLDYCGLFRDRWGRAELDRALRIAHRLAPLEEPLGRLLADAASRA